MTYLLTVDTETSDLPIWSTPSEHPDQPFVISIAMLKLDPVTFEEIDHFYSILKPPPGRVIPEDGKAFEAHGITQARALSEGAERDPIIKLYAKKRRECVSSLAHNASFDVRMMRIELLRLGASKDEIDAIEASSPQLCTMKAATPVLDLPATGRMKAAGFCRKPKSPSLAECIRLLLEENPDEQAHNALADARACARIFRRLRQMQDAA